MSDTRFTIIGIGLIFAGFLILGIFGERLSQSSLEATEFGDCYEYFEDREPIPVNCESRLQDRLVFFGLVIALIAAGILCLVKGVKGKWDQQVRPEDMLGPGGDKTINSDEDNDSSSNKPK